MSVPVQVPISGPYTANGSTTQFGYQFYLLLASDLDVFVGGAKKILNTDYTVTGVGNSAGGNVVFTVAPASGLEVIIKRNTPFTRTTDYADNGDLLADVVNDDFDRLWLALQEINANFGSSISRPVGGNWTAQNLRLTMLADGTQPQDAVTYKQLFTVNGNAAAAADAAAQSASAAAASQQSATTSASNAATSEANSGTSAALARRWAAETPDTVVADNLYSARHYASNAATSASNAATSESTASTAATNATNAAGTANSAATTATTQADRAKTEADKLGNMNALAAAINSVDSQNNVTWKSKLTLGNVAVNDMDAATLSQVNDAKRDAKSAANIFSSISGAASAPANGAVVYGGDLASKYQVAGVDYATAVLRSKVVGGTAPARSAVLDIGDNANGKKTWEFTDQGDISAPAAAWTVPTLANGWAIINAGVVRTGYRKRMGNIEISLNAQANGPKNDGTVIFTLPAGMRPTNIISLASNQSDNSNVPRIDINPNGDVVSQGYNGTQRNFRGFISFPADM